MKVSDDLHRYLLKNLRGYIDKLGELAEAENPSLDWIDYFQAQAGEIITILEGGSAHDSGHTTNAAGGLVS